MSARASLLRTAVAILAALGGLASVTATALSADARVKWDGSEPPPGVYFHWYEPSFYTGFAPRTQNGKQAHIELSRGNQVRFTIVLGPEELDAYASDLIARRDVVDEMVKRGVIELTTNKQHERFSAKLAEVGVEAVVAEKDRLGPEAYREKAVELIAKLNPGRVFRIRIPLERAAADWHAALLATSDAAFATKAGALDAANAALPGRLNLYELDPKLQAALSEARRVAASQPTSSASFQEKTGAFIEQASDGRYSVRDGTITADEFTAIYPAGTIEGWTQWQGQKLPAFGVTGVWSLISRDRGRGLVGMTDYLSPNPGYGFISMLPYQDAGGIFYNAFHNAGVRSQLNSTPFLPDAWRKVGSERDPKKPYQNLWVVSRGPTSHGCTRLPSGHMSEMRNALPSSSDALEGVDTFRNLPQCYEVFDVDGDGKVEVMGVKYYLAYRSQKHTPVQAYVQNNRKSYYEWLYGSNIAYQPDGSVVVKEVPTCRFVGKRKAEEAKVYRDLPLYEPDYETETIQFYRIKPVSFESNKGFELNRELRKVGVGHTTDRAKLLLQ